MPLDRDDRVLLPSIVLAYLPQGGKLCELTSQVAEEGDRYYPWESALGTRMDGMVNQLLRLRQTKKSLEKKDMIHDAHQYYYTVLVREHDGNPRNWSSGSCPQTFKARI